MGKIMNRARAAYPGFATATILAVLFLQTVAVIKPIRWAIWPFTNYPMYKTPHFDGDTISVSVRVFADLADGTTAEFFPRDVGLSWFKFYEHAKCVIPTGDCPDPASYSGRLAELIELSAGQPITRLVAKSYPAIITVDGVVEVESVVLGETSIVAPKSQRFTAN